MSKEIACPKCQNTEEHLVVMSGEAHFVATGPLSVDASGKVINLPDEPDRFEFDDEIAWEVVCKVCDFRFPFPSNTTKESNDENSDQSTEAP